MSLVQEFPLVEDFKFASMLPDWVEVRDYGKEAILLTKDGEFYVTMAWPSICKPAMEAALNNLSGTVFEKRHPGFFGGMVKRQARWQVNGKKGYPPDDVELWKEYNQLHSWRK